MGTDSRIPEIKDNLKQDAKELLGESARLVTNFFKRGLCTVRAAADKWKQFAKDISTAADTLMQPPFVAGPEAPDPTLDPARGPIVTVTESGLEQMPVGKQMTLPEANALLETLDEIGVDPQTVRVKIDYTLAGKSDRYWLDVAVADGQGPIQKQVKTHIETAKRTPIQVELAGLAPEMQQQFAPFLQQSFEDVSTRLVDFLEKHCAISELEGRFEAQAKVLPEAAQQDFRALAGEAIAAQRREVNDRFLTPPETAARTGPEKEMGPKRETPRPSVKITLRAIQEERAQPHNSKPLRPKER